MEQKPIITLRDVTKVYHVGSVDVHALRGVDLTVAPGELCCIIGRSGSGKSTLLNLLAGLEPATSGEIIIANKHLERMNQSELILFRQKHVGFIFQSFNLMPYYTALENVAFPLSFRGVPKAVRLRRAKEALKTVGLESHMKHKPSQMSGGQQQRALPDERRPAATGGHRPGPGHGPGDHLCRRAHRQPGFQYQR